MIYKQYVVEQLLPRLTCPIGSFLSLDISDGEQQCHNQVVDTIETCETTIACLD